jgi:hypothetical protein
MGIDREELEELPEEPRCSKKESIRAPNADPR